MQKNEAGKIQQTLKLLHHIKIYLCDSTYPLTEKGETVPN